MTALTNNANWNSGKPTAEIVVPVSTGSGAVFTLKNQSSRTVGIDASKGLTIGNSTSAVDIATFTVTSACTVTVSGKAGGAYDSSKIRSLKFGDNSIYTMSPTSPEKESFEQSFSAVAGVTYTVNGNGTNILTITCN